MTPHRQRSAAAAPAPPGGVPGETRPAPHEPGRPLVIVETLGGLGNQMFQYAAAAALAARTGARVKLDTRRLQASGSRRLALGGWRVDVELATPEEIRRVRRDTAARRAFRVASRLVRRPVLDVYLERAFHYEERFASLAPPVYLHGYFQSPRYFAGWEDELRRRFTPREEPSAEAREALRRIAAAPVSVGVHVRRGDLVRHPSARAVHGVLDAAYYRRSLQLVGALTGGEAQAFVVSDEPEAALALLDGAGPATVVGGAPDRQHEDVLLLAACTHAVIANSSFSWWGAWLGTAPGRVVIAPRMWMTREQLRARSLVDLIPDDWILL